MNPQETQELVPVAQATESRAVTKFTAAHGQEVGLPSPEAVNYMMSVAKLLLDSSLITGDMGRTPEQVRANALAKMLVGHELGMQPMEALQDIDIVKGKVFIRYPQLINQILLRGFRLNWIERSHERAAVRLTHKNPEIEPVEFEFTIADAKLAGLVYADSQYIKRPRVMLTARVISEAYRSTGGRSNVYTPEERSEVLREEPAEPQHAEPPQKAENPYKVVAIQPTAEPVQTLDSQQPTIGETRPDPPEAGIGLPPGTVQHRVPPGLKIENGVIHGTPTEVGTFQLLEVYPNLDKTPEAPAVPVVAEPQTVAEASKVVEMPKTNTVINEIAALVPANVQDKVLKEFLRGFLQSPAKRNDPRTPDALTCMLAIAKAYLPQLLQDPYGCGVQATAGWKALNKFIDKWPADSKDMTRVIALQKYADTGGGDLVGYLEDPIHVESMNKDDIRVLLTILANCEFSTATALREKSIAADIPLAMMLRNFEQPWTDGAILSLLSFAGDAPAQPAEDDATEEDMTSLFAAIRGESVD